MQFSNKYLNIPVLAIMSYHNYYYTHFFNIHMQAIAIYTLVYWELIKFYFRSSVKSYLRRLMIWKIRYGKVRNYEIFTNKLFLFYRIRFYYIICSNIINLLVLNRLRLALHRLTVWNSRYYWRGETKYANNYMGSLQKLAEHSSHTADIVQNLSWVWSLWHKFYDS